jgi:aspartate-semialdehyde dehydrogenase
MERYRVGIVGATGLVGQRLVQRLEGHPWFDLVAVAASERSAGKTYAEATTWRLPTPMPSAVAGLRVGRCVPGDLDGCDVVLSGLDAATAKEVEPALAAHGIAVLSNASAFRMTPDVPLLVPEVNAAHASLVDAQRTRTGWPGFLATNPNCSATGLVLALAPLHREFGVKRVIVSTMQALSGAGLEGPRGLDVVDNVVPYIGGEEEKLESEIGKMLGAPILVSAHCHRVATIDGHLEAVSVELERDATPEQAVAAFASFRGDVADRGLPSSPERPIVVRSEVDRPQPRLDRDTGGGMSAVVGRVRRCPVFSLRFEVLSHNTVRGAAGATLMNAELFASLGKVPRRSGR